MTCTGIHPSHSAAWMSDSLCACTDLELNEKVPHISGNAVIYRHRPSVQYAARLRMHFEWLPTGTVSYNNLISDLIQELATTSSGWLIFKDSRTTHPTVKHKHMWHL
jgi:hypothetical protein